MSDEGRPEDQWGRAYLTAVAQQLHWWFSSDWRDLRRVDSRLDHTTIPSLLVILHAPSYDPALAPKPFRRRDEDPSSVEEDALREEVARLRAAGAAVFADPWLPSFHITATSPWPLQVSGLLDVADEDRERVILVQFNDFPKHHPAWFARRRLVDFPAVESLSMESNDLVDAIGIDLPALPHLRVLNLEGNGLIRLPEEVAGCHGLEALMLSRNPDLGPSLTPEALTAVGDLRLLDLRDTGVSAPLVGEMRQALPNCQIWS